MKETKIVYSITKAGDKTYWTPVGIASDNRDGSIGILLNAVPLSGKLQIRKRREKGSNDEGASGQ